mgnify:CR=1 FL=1
MTRFKLLRMWQVMYIRTNQPALTSVHNKPKIRDPCGVIVPFLREHNLKYGPILLQLALLDLLSCTSRESCYDL